MIDCKRVIRKDRAFLHALRRCRRWAGDLYRIHRRRELFRVRRCKAGLSATRVAKKLNIRFERRPYTKNA
jgi:hypothetical protein